MGPGRDRDVERPRRRRLARHWPRWCSRSGCSRRPTRPTSAGHGYRCSELHGEAALARLAEAGGRRAPRHESRQHRAARARLDRHTGSEDALADQVVLAVPPAAAEALLPAGSLPAAPGWAGQLGALTHHERPHCSDRPVLGEPFLATVGSPVQWVFDRTGRPGLTTGQYLAMSISAADDFVDTPVAEIRPTLLPELGRMLPAVRGPTWWTSSSAGSGTRRSGRPRVRAGSRAARRSPDVPGWCWPARGPIPGGRPPWRVLCEVGRRRAAAGSPLRGAGYRALSARGERQRAPQLASGTWRGGGERASHRSLRGVRGSMPAR